MADAGPDQSAWVGHLVTLDGRGSYDPDGHIPLTFGWLQVGGPPVTLDAPGAIIATFAAPDAPTVLTFTLTVTDAYGLPDPTPDEVIVTVKAGGWYVYLPMMLRDYAP